MREREQEATHFNTACPARDAAAFEQYPAEELCGYFNLNAMRRDGFKAGWDARDEEVRKACAALQFNAEQFTKEMNEKNEEVKRLQAELDSWSKGGRGKKLAELEAENKRLTELVWELHKDRNPEDLSPEARELMRHVSLKAGGR